MVLSYGEVFVIIGAAALLIGPKELPGFARVAGRATGRAVSLMQELRSKLITVANEAEVTKLHEEVQQGLQELRAIRHELRGGINIMNPGPVAQRTFGLKASPGGFGQDSNGEGPFAPSPPYQEPGGFASSQLHESGRSPGLFSNAPPGANRENTGEGLQPMPVSAVMAGIAPERSKSVPTGADIMLDALAEEDVAHKARHFLGQQPELRRR